MAKGEGGGGRSGGGNDLLSGGYSGMGSKWNPGGAAGNSGQHIGKTLGKMSVGGTSREVQGEILINKNANINQVRITVRGRPIYTAAGKSTLSASKAELNRLFKSGFTSNSGSRVDPSS